MGHPKCNYLYNLSIIADKIAFCLITAEQYIQVLKIFPVVADEKTDTDQGPPTDNCHMGRRIGDKI